MCVPHTTPDTEHIEVSPVGHQGGKCLLVALEIWSSSE